jgi:hypothetical protein
MWNAFVEPGRPQMTIWRMRIAFWIPKATNTHTGCPNALQCYVIRTLPVLFFVMSLDMVLVVVEKKVFTLRWTPSFEAFIV